MEYRCFHSKFTQDEYEKYKTSVWALPAAWATDNPPPLAAWRNKAGDGVASILPLVGRMACAERRHDFALSIQELARLSGVDPATVDKARDMFAAENIATTKVLVDDKYGQSLTHWTVSPALCIEEARECFFFHMRLIYGGVWAMMPKVLRTIYLAVATKASVFHNPAAHWLYRDVLRPGSELADIWRGYELVGGGRWAFVSHREISRICGVTGGTMSKWAQMLKHPAVWKDSKAHPTLIEYLPIWVYPTVGRKLIYHFRDHVPAWPCEVLNEHRRSRLTDADLASMLPATPAYHVGRNASKAAGLEASTNV